MYSSLRSFKGCLNYTLVTGNKQMKEILKSYIFFFIIHRGLQRFLVHTNNFFKVDTMKNNILYTI